MSVSEDSRSAEVFVVSGRISPDASQIFSDAMMLPVFSLPLVEISVAGRTSSCVDISVPEAEILVSITSLPVFSGATSGTIVAHDSEETIVSSAITPYGIRFVRRIPLTRTPAQICFCREYIRKNKYTFLS